MTEEDLYDLGQAFIRPRLANVKGASLPLPYGGKVRQVQVDVDPNLMYSHHISATDVSTAFNQQNLILPAGVARMGDREFVVKMNSSPPQVSALNDLPIRSNDGAIVSVKDVAQVRLGYAPQVNVVRQDGKRAALLTVLKNGDTSTLDIVKGVKELLPQVKAGLPPALTVTPLFDQSIFVSESISEVVPFVGTPQDRSKRSHPPSIALRAFLAFRNVTHDRQGKCRNEDWRGVRTCVENLLQCLDKRRDESLLARPENPTRGCNHQRSPHRDTCRASLVAYEPSWSMLCSPGCVPQFDER